MVFEVEKPVEYDFQGGQPVQYGFQKEQARTA